MAVQKSKQTRVAGIIQLTSRHPSYICYQSVYDFMKDVGMTTCKLSSCSSCLFAFLYRHPYFIHNLFNCFLYLFMLFLYDCKSTSIAIYSQDEVVMCISGGIYYAGSIYIIY